MNYDTTARNFLVHFPPGLTSTPNLPVVINMHGLGSNGAQQEFYSRMDETSDANGFIVVYPNGLNNSWNSGFAPPYNSKPDDVGFISKIIDTLYQLYNIDLTRVYACGMSNGGFQSYRLACDLENRIAAVASVTGAVSDLIALNCVLSRKVPVMQIHGTADPLVPYAGETGIKSTEETINFWLGMNSCNSAHDTVFYPDIDVNDSSTVQRIRYATCGSGTEVLFYKIIGGGHTWPNAYLDFIYGPTNRDFDASQEIWDFFNRYTLNGTAGFEEMKNEIEVNVFPNPTDNSFQFAVSGLQFSEMRTELFDVAGRKISEKKNSSSATEFNVSELSRGVYFLKISAKNFLVTKKIVKQ